LNDATHTECISNYGGDKIVTTMVVRYFSDGLKTNLWTTLENYDDNNDMLLRQYLLVQNHPSLGLKCSCSGVITGSYIFVKAIYAHSRFVAWQQYNSYNDHYLGT
jgi:hypothetical protein